MKPDSDSSAPSEFRWLRTGDQAMAEMLGAIDRATHSVRMEMYIFNASPIAERFREALIHACQRGLKVQVLIDAFGSITLPESFWQTFRESGGKFRWFNPLKLKRLSLRDHRKILVCDDRIGFVGGFNISTEYQGNGVTDGWRDLGLRIRGPLVPELSRAFDEMFAQADFRQGLFRRLRRSSQQRTVTASDGKLLLSAPGRERSPLKAALYQDLKGARRVQIICAYFLPTWRLRRELFRVALRGGKVQLILPGKSDVPLSRLASQSLYRRMFRIGIEIYEYQPQILHAKLIVIDDVVYAGSANLDVRSLHMNYELLIRIDDARLAAEAREIFNGDLRHCLRIQPAAWRRTRTLWGRLKGRWAYFLLARVDPFLARQQLKLLR